MRLGAKWAIGVVCVVGALTAAVCRWPIRSATVESEVNQTISPRLGLHLRRPANATFALLPWPTLRVVGVDLADGQDRSLLSAPAAKFPLSLTGLMRGRLVPVGATWQNPTALIDLDAGPAAAEERALSDTQDEEPPVLWSHVRLLGGVLRVVSASRRFDTLIENIEGSLDWPAADRPLRLALVGAWRDETVRIDGRIDNPRAGLEGGSTGLRLAVDARPLSLSLEGAWSGAGGGAFAGDVSAQIRSLTTLERLLGARPAAIVAGDAVSIDGKIQTDGSSFSLSDSKFEIGGQKIDGALTLSRQAERAAISGTLAADSVRLEALLPAAPAPLIKEGMWSARPFGFEPPRDLDLDLRFSVAHADWAGRRIDDAAGSVMCREGRLTAKLLQASAYQGALQGELTLASGSAGLEAQMSGSLADADVGAALADFGWSGYRGRGSFDLSLKATGLSPDQAIASLAGTAAIDLQAGLVEGVNVEEAIRRSQRRPIDVDRDITTGQLRFSRARARFIVSGGKAKIVSAQADGPGAALSAQGAFDLAARRLDVRAIATQADAQGATSANAARLTIMLSGPWAAPAVIAVPGG